LDIDGEKPVYRLPSLVMMMEKSNYATRRPIALHCLLNLISGELRVNGAEQTEAGIFEQKELEEAKSQPVSPRDDGEAGAGILFEAGELLQPRPPALLCILEDTLRSIQESARKDPREHIL
jgi:hypothetical protein